MADPANNYYNPGTTTVSGCMVTGNFAFEGGGLYDAAGTTTVSGSELENNSATYGGNPGRDHEQAGHDLL